MRYNSCFSKWKTKLNNIIEYSKIKKEWEKVPAPSQDLIAINDSLKGSPSNHVYSISGGKLFPAFKLFERYNMFRKLLPKKLESFLDIGCCKGYYVFKTAERSDCIRSVGIDVHKPFIELSQKVKEKINADKTQFFLTSIDNVVKNKEKFGAPFQVVLLIGTYHYLFWGSSYCPDAAYLSHEKILSMLSDICTDSVILSGKLEVEQLAPWEKAKAKKLMNPYSTALFLDTAKRFFDVKLVGYYGKYPLFLMKKL